MALGGAALVLAPKIAHYMCPPDCGKPPSGTPVMALPRFESPDGAFSVAYPAPGSAYTISTTQSGVTATYTGGDGGVLQLFSEPARGRSARRTVRHAPENAGRGKRPSTRGFPRKNWRNSRRKSAATAASSTAAK